MALGGIITGAVARSLLLVNPFRYGVKQGAVNSFLFDLVTEETRELSAEVTENKIQNGSDITDHIYFNLAQGTLTGKVSNHSVYALPGASGYLKDRFKAAYSAIERVYQRGELVTIYCVMRKYENVIINRLTMDRDADEGRAQSFTIGFKETRIVTPDAGVVRASTNVDMTDPDNRQASPVLNLGAQ
jgi:hypothetical protein